MAIKSMGLMSVLLTFVTVFMLTSRVNGQGLEGNAQLPTEFSDLWLIYDMANAAQWPAMTLSDGSLTTAVNDVLSSSVSTSKRRTSTRWATFNVDKSGAQLVARFPSWKAARAYFISDKSIAIEDDFRLNECFVFGKVRQKHDQSETLPTKLSETPVEPATVCFSSTGNFTTKGVKLSQRGQSFETSLTVGVQQGVYRVTGNLITFEYDDGSRFLTILGAYRFGAQAPVLSAISIAEHVLFKQPDEEYFPSLIDSLRGS